MTSTVAWGAVAFSADWRTAAPEGWLAAVEASDLAALESQAAQLAEPWGIAIPPFGRLVAGLAPGATAPRAWGAVAVESDAGPLGLVVYVPTDDFAALVRALDADRAEDLAIADLLGFEVAMKPSGGWAAVTLLDSADLLDLAPTTAPPERLETTLSIACSPAGLQRLADLADRRAMRRGQRRPSRFDTPGLPSSVQDLLVLLGRERPLLEALAAVGAPLSLGLEINQADDSVRLVGSWGVDTLDPAGAHWLAPAEGPIARLSLAGAPPEPLLELALAWVAASPDRLLEARRYAQPQWDDFESAARDLLRRIDSLALAAATPAEGEPLAANQSARFGWRGEGAELGDALQLAVTRWNRLVEATRCRTPMRASLAPLPEAGGWRLVLDVLGSQDEEQPLEVREILERFYGHPDGAHVDVVPTAGGRWQATLTPPDLRTNEAEQRQPTEPATLAIAEVYLDRWFALEARQARVGLEEAIGRVEPQPMEPAAPVKLRLTGGEALHLEATLPLDAYEKAVSYTRRATP